jgi:hypothetical protein
MSKFNYGRLERSHFYFQPVNILGVQGDWRIVVTSPVNPYLKYEVITDLHFPGFNAYDVKENELPERKNMQALYSYVRRFGKRVR